MPLSHKPLVTLSVVSFQTGEFATGVPPGGGGGSKMAEDSLSSRQQNPAPGTTL